MIKHMLLHFEEKDHKKLEADKERMRKELKFTKLPWTEYFMRAAVRRLKYGIRKRNCNRVQKD